MTHKATLAWENYAIPSDLPNVTINDSSLPLVSIVTPSYNQGKFIRETIESVLYQDYPNIEYWVIDGQSTDNTIDIVREYERDPRFNWISEPDRGQSDAINKGWSRSRGQILAWLNSDDVYTQQDVISKQSSRLDSGKGIELVYADCVYTDEEGKVLGLFPAKPFSYYTFLRACHIPQPTVFLTRRLMDKVGCININLHYTMDYDYWLRCAEYSTFDYNRQVMATSRLHADSKTVSASIPASYDAALLAAVAMSSLQDRLQPQQRRKIFAAAHLGVATAYARNGKMRKAWHFAKRAMRFSKTDKRWGTLVLAACNYYSNNKHNLEVKAMHMQRRLTKESQ